jgi:UTP--glucose-1-phosphate uridylyltransferase
LIDLEGNPEPGLNIPSQILSSSSSMDLFCPTPETQRSAVVLTRENLVKIGMDEEDIQPFLELREKYIKKIPVDWEKVYKPDNSFYQEHYEKLPAPDKPKMKQLLEQTVVILMNGGVSKMDFKTPRSALTVEKNGITQTLLDCRLAQINALNVEFGVDLPIILMNSFLTNTETNHNLQKYQNLKIKILHQGMYPLMYKTNLSPIPQSKNDPNWSPPGSAEIFVLLKTTGLLDELLKEGKKFAFLSDVENLGATIDPKLLYHVEQKQINLLLEVTPRTKSEGNFMGGVPVLFRKKQHILELSQVPMHIRQTRFNFQDFKYLNTNNIWISLQTLAKIEKISMDWALHSKMQKGREVVYIDTPVSMAIQSFPNPTAITVPRQRYRQVHHTSHLLAVQSDLYVLENGNFKLNPKRIPPTEPLLKLGDGFKTLDDYQKRFSCGPPSLLEIDHLTVSGEVNFGSDVVLKGTVIIVADAGSRIDIPQGTTLENKILSGSFMMENY